MKHDDSTDSRASASAKGRQTGAPGPTQDQLKVRLRRLEVLRGAARAITPSIAGQPTTSPFDGAELAASLAKLAQRVAALEECVDPAVRDSERRSITRALSDIDQELGAAGINLLGITDGIPLVQLRASLPGIARQRRFDVLALLDLLVLDQKGIVDRSVLFDYLVTLLASDEQDGKRWVAHDPAALIPRLRLLCQRAESRSGDEARAAEQEFYAAASPDQGHEDLEPLLARIRKRKQSLGQLLFVPAVLRAVVTYNVAIANRIEDELEQTKQDSDQEMSSLSAFVGGDDDLELPPDAQRLDAGSAFGEGSENAERTEKPEEAGSVFESPGIRAIARAIRLRSEGSASGTTSHERIAGRMDLADLKENELAFLAGVDAEGGEPVMGLTVVVGLLLRTALESALDLREIGIDPERLQQHWAVELDRALQALVNDRVVSNAYEEACALTELKTRFLYESVSSLASRVRQPVPATFPSTAGTRKPGPRRPAKQTRTPGAAKAAPGSWNGRPWDHLARAGAAVLGVLGALALAKALLWDAGRLGVDELDRVSLLLSSGVRNGEGSGPAFVGEVKDDWLALEAADQMRAAAVLVQKLREQGVREIMIYDDDGGLRIQALGDRPPQVVPASDG